MKSVIRPAARDDIIRQYRHYLVEAGVPEVAERFLESVEQSIGAITRRPELGAPKLLPSKALRSLRSWPVKDFADIRVYYVVQDELLRVVRVLHGKRDVERILVGSGKRGLLN